MIGQIASAFTGGLMVAFLGTVLFTVTMPFESYHSMPLDIIAFAVFWIATLVFTLLSDDACASWKWQMYLSTILSFIIAVYAYHFPELITAIKGVNFYQAAPADVITYAGLFAGMVFLYMAVSITNKRKNPFTRIIGCKHD